VCDVGIDGGSITAVGGALDGATTVDVRGLVVDLVRYPVRRRGAGRAHA
jgi:hypothetical protein